jgi:hypothetical protein
VEWSGETHIYILPGVVQCPKLLLLLVVVDSRHRHHDKDSAENRKTLPNYATIRQTSHVLWFTKALALGFSSPQATPFRHFQRGPKQRISMPRSTETPETDPSAPRVRSPCPITGVRTKRSTQAMEGWRFTISTSARCADLGSCNHFHGQGTWAQGSHQIESGSSWGTKFEPKKCRRFFTWSTESAPRSRGRIARRQSTSRNYPQHCQLRPDNAPGQSIGHPHRGTEIPRNRIQMW